MKSDMGRAFASREYKLFCENRNFEIEYSPPILHAGTGAVERPKETLKNLSITNPEDKIGLSGSMNQVLRVIRFTIHTGPKMSPFELHHGRKPRTELTNLIERNKSYLSDWTTLNVSVPPKQILLYVARKTKRRGDGPYDFSQEEENPILRITPITKKKTSQTG